MAGDGAGSVTNTSDKNAHGETAVNLFFLKTGLAVPGQIFSAYPWDIPLTVYFKVCLSFVACGGTRDRSREQAQVGKRVDLRLSSGFATNYMALGPLFSSSGYSIYLRV